LVCDAIIKHGTDEQKETYVKPLLRGEIFAAECLTERAADPIFRATTKAEDRGDDFLINGQKRFIVAGRGPIIFFSMPERISTRRLIPMNRITAFIVDRGPEWKRNTFTVSLGCRGGGTARLVFKDVKVPKKNVLEGQWGYDVFNTMMIPERLGTALMTIGSVRPALEIATSYSSRRKAFGQIIATFEGVQLPDCRSGYAPRRCRSLGYTTARAVDSEWI